MQRKMKMKRFNAILLAAVVGVSLAFPAQALAYIPEDQDQTPATEEEIQEALASGEIQVIDQEAAANGISAFAAVPDDYQVDTSKKIVSFAGATRIETAIMQAYFAFPNGSDGAIIVSTNAWPDALAATSLAGALDYPILYTEIGYVPDDVLGALGALGVSHIIAIGDQAVISSNAENQLKSVVGSGGDAFKRVSGSDRFKTQMAIYEYGKSLGLWSSDWVVVASGENFPDALSISPFTAAERAPIFLANSSRTLNNDQKKAISSAGFSNAMAIGDDVVVSNATVDYLKGATTGKSAVRLSGSDRYATSAAVARYLADRFGYSWSNAALASGEKPYDALAGGVVQGKARAVMVLVGDWSGTPNSQTKSVFDSQFNGNTTVRVFGSKAAVPMPAQMYLADRMGVPRYQLEGFKVYVDAGHGWNDSNNGALDPGAVAGGRQEYAINKEMADKVANILRDQYGVEVFLNDDGGWYKLRHAEAVANNCDAIVSFHVNAGGGSGVESYVHSYAASWYSDIWRSSIHDALASSFGIGDRGRKYDELAILNGSLPATLLELGFIDNSSDMAKYDQNKNAIAQAVAKAIAE